MNETFYALGKRITDISLAMLGGFLFLPVVLITAVFIKMTSRGSIIYKQERIGLRGETFLLYKFRSMIIEAEKDSGPILASEDDSRVTKLGKIMRKTRMDELPQFINILKGDMSIVGPRPERPFFVKQHKSLQGVRLLVKPGLTGLAQIEGAYHTHPRNKLRYDFIYIKNRSLFFDIKIILKTVLVVLTRKGT